MTFDEIERILGKASVDELQDLIGRMLEHSPGSSANPVALVAVQELLIAMLAGLIITPKDNAAERVHHAADRLLAVVSQALQCDFNSLN